MNRQDILPVGIRSMGAALRQCVVAAARHPVAVAAVLAGLMGSTYWLLVASDRYVSEARIVVQRTDIPGSHGADFLGGLLGAGAPGRGDQLLLREHLLSLDMVARLDATLQIGDHYSQPGADLLSRMWWRGAPLEWLHRHYLGRTRVEFDEYTGVLTLQAQAYDPALAQAITRMLVEVGERFMNDLAHRLAQAQVDFLQAQVAAHHDKALAARAAVLAFQDSQGLISADGAAQSLHALVARLEAQRTELQVQRASLTAYLVPEHPQVVRIEQQIAALEGQLRRERARLASPGGQTLSRTLEALQRLEAQAAFAQDLYKASLLALEKGQIEAHRVVKKVSVLQAPSQPHYPLEPRRLYNALVFALLVGLLAGVVQLAVAIVRDHRD